MVRKYAVSGTKACKSDDTTSRNVKIYEPLVERGERSKASVPESVVGQERGPFGLSGGAYVFVVNREKVKSWNFKRIKCV